MSTNSMTVGKATVVVGDYVVVRGPRCNWGVVEHIDSDGVASIHWIGSIENRDLHWEMGADADDLLDDSVEIWPSDAREEAHEAFLGAIREVAS